MAARIRLTDCISYLPATESPFCCDIVFVEDGGCTWILDVGAGSAASAEIQSVSGTKRIVLSHFHPDHTVNLPFVTYDELYVSAYTKKYVRRGTVIDSSLRLGNVSVLPMPSSHAKGCLALTCGDYAFLGDGAFCKYRGVHHLYNVQLLNDMLAFMRTLDCTYFCLDHEKNFVQEKESVIALYSDIYGRRKTGEPYICVDDFFRFT